MATALQITALTKSYNGSSTPAVNALTLSVSSGEVYGFLGSNGAGKSTTIRTILNFLKPTSGTITINGKDSVSNSTELKRQIGYLAGDVALYPKVTGAALLKHLAQLHGSIDNDYFTLLTKRFEAELNKPIGELSKGNRQKIGILQAFMHKPSLLVLDEPTSGLDPLMQERFYETAAEAKQRGAAIFLSSHNLSEAQRICDRIGIIKAGTLVREASIDELQSLNKPIFEITFADAEAVYQLKTSAAVRVLNVQGDRVVLQPSDDLQSALQAIAAHKLSHFSSKSLDLEDEFLTFYETDKTTESTT